MAELGLRCRAPGAFRQLRKNEFLKDTGERRLTNSDQGRREDESGSAAIVRGEVGNLQSGTGKTSNDIRVIRLPASIVPFADNRTGHGIENPGSLAAASFVEVAWILLENRRHDRASDER